MNRGLFATIWYIASLIALCGACSGLALGLLGVPGTTSITIVGLCLGIPLFALFSVLSERASFSFQVQLERRYHNRVKAEQVRIATQAPVPQDKLTVSKADVLSKLNLAREYVKAKDYKAAREVLWLIHEYPEAQALLRHLDSPEYHQ